MLPALLLASLAAAAPPGKAPDVDDTLERILENGYQTELPGDTSAAGAEERGGSPIGRRGSGPVLSPVSAPVTRVLFWVVVGGAAFLLLAFAISELRGRRAAAAAGRPGGGPGEPRAGPALTEKPLDDAEELARRGRFGEAIRVLLLRTLAELARRLPIPSSRTSREIVTESDVPGDARQALHSLVAAVEVSHFGGAVPDRGDYDACVERFRAFAAACRGAGW